MGYVNDMVDVGRVVVVIDTVNAGRLFVHGRHDCLGISAAVEEMLKNCSPPNLA